MADIIVPSNVNYSAQLESIRRLASPNAAAPLSTAQLPDAFITDPIYLDSQERYVLRKLNRTSAPNSGDSDYERIVYLVQLRVAIKLLPQLPSILRQTMVGETIQIQEYDLEKRLADLEEEYMEETEVIVPDSSSSRLEVNIKATDKKMFPSRNTSWGYWS